jgi:hypothetical protein
MKDTASQVAHEHAIDLAERELPAIEQLLDSPGWTYLSRRLRERQQAIRDNIADNDTLPDHDTRKLRAMVKEINAILALPAQDRVLHRATIERARQKSIGPARG